MKLVRFLALGAAGVTLVAGLGACSQQPDQAFKYNDVVYSLADMQQAVSEYFVITGSKLDAQSIANSLFASQVVIQTAKDDYQMEVSDKEAQDILLKVQQQKKVADPIKDPGRGLLDIAKATALSSHLSVISDTETLNQQFSKSLDSADKELNPRLGLKITAGKVQTLTGFGDVVSLGATAAETAK